jgi:gluconolactonase
MRSPIPPLAAAALFVFTASAADISASKPGVPRGEVTNILISGEEWRAIAGTYRSADGLAANGAGEVFFSDRQGGRILKIGIDESVAVFKDEAAGGLYFGPDGRLYACEGGKKRIMAFDGDGKEEVIAESITPNDLAIDQHGHIYVTDSPNKKVWLINSRHEKRVVDEGISFPNGIRFSSNQSQLYVADYRGQLVYSFGVRSDGTLRDRQPYGHMRLVDGSAQSSADGMTVDSLGRLYVTTEMGIQVCDPAGHVDGTVTKPANRTMNSIAFGGKDFDTLFVSCGDKVYARKTSAKGVLSFQPPTMSSGPKEWNRK